VGADAVEVWSAVDIGAAVCRGQTEHLSHRRFLKERACETMMMPMQLGVGWGVLTAHGGKSSMSSDRASDVVLSIGAAATRPKKGKARMV
jgi:hypothetical protein